jgi:hypothetical protein
MLPETHPLIEAVTEPLTDNAEHRLATHALLGETFNPEHAGIDEAIARLEATGQRKFSKLRKVWPWLMAVVALGYVVATYIPSVLFMESLANVSMFDPYETPALPAGLTEKESLILGDPKLDALEQKRQLHRSDPANPAYYAEYAQTWHSEHQSLPPDFLETVTRIDPENAFFLYLAAANVGSESIEKKSRSYSGSPRYAKGVRLNPRPKPTEYTILDQANYQKALELIEKAASLPRLETHMSEMVAVRSRILPDDTFIEFSAVLIHVYSAPIGVMSLIKVSDLLSARAEELSKSGAEEAFLKLAAQRDAFINGMGRNPDKYLVNELVYAAIVSTSATSFHAAADQLGLTELAETYRSQRDAIQKDKDDRKIRGQNDDEGPISSYSVFHYLTLPSLDGQVNSPPPITAADLEPMRRVEHEIAGGIGVIAVALSILSAALLVFLFRFIVPQAIRLPAKRMACLVRPSDWVWVVILGIAMPIAVFLIITRLTPFSGREYGVSYIQLIFPGVHLVALLLSLLMVPAFVLRRRLIKRLAPFGIPDRFGLFPLFVIAGLVVWSLAVQPIIKHFGFSEEILYVMAAPPALCLCFIFANTLRVIFEKSSTRFIQVATAMAVLPVYPIAIAALCFLLPIYHAGEKEWLAKETLLRIDPDAPDLGAYEFKVAAQKRKEINAIIGIE